MKTKNIKLVLSCGALAVLGVLSVQGCSSSDDSTGGAGTGGTSSAGKGGTSSTAGKGGTAGTSTGGKGGSGTAGTGTAGTGTGGKGGAGTGGTGGAAGAGDVAGATNEGGAAGAASDVVHPSTVECSAFCDLEATACTGANLAYSSTAVCNTECAAFALGDDSDPTRTSSRSGDNFACRAYHLHNVVMTAMPAVHCPHTANVSLNSDGSKGPCAN